MTLTLPGPLVSPEWLASHLDEPPLIVLDASAAPAQLAEEAIGNALRFDIDGPFSDRSTSLPHTMPSADDFGREAQALGVDGDSVIVVYDSMGTYSAPRAWWMLRAMGHDAVAVLDGGLPAWQAAGFPTTSHGTAVEGDFEPAPRAELIVDAHTVAERLEDESHVILDARSRGRFAGRDPEPRPGLRGGHIPGSKNLPYTELLRDGRFLPVEELRSKLDELANEHQALTMSCGSGVTACILALAATLAGRESISVYDGSWAEWGRPGERPVEEGDA